MRLEPTISCINCFKLVRNEGCNQVLHAMFKRYIQGLSYIRSRFDIILPGSQIPEWFNQLCTGPIVVIHLPPDCCEAKFVGFSLCTAFVVKDRLLEGPGLEVKQTGACLVYEEDVQKFQQSMTNPSRSLFGI